MSSIFDKWTSAVGGERLAKEVKEISESEQEYREVPQGKYEVKLEKMELKECKSQINKGLPMLSIQFRISEGEYKNSCIFYNQLVYKSFSIHKANEFLRSLDSGIDVDFDGNYADYNNLILDIGEKIIKDKVEYLLDYRLNNKGYNEYEILEVYDLPF